MIKYYILTFLIIGVVFSQVNLTSAHPGNTDASGGHTCRTNCADWGLYTGQYHYHEEESYYDDGDEEEVDNMSGKAVEKFQAMDSQNYELDEEGRVKIYSDDQMKQFQSEREAVTRKRLFDELEKEKQKALQEAAEAKKKQEDWRLNALSFLQNTPSQATKSLGTVGNMLIATISSAINK
jgi:hypothetical protein